MSMSAEHCIWKLLIALIMCACCGVAAFSESESEHNPIITDVSQIKDIDFTGLSDAQKAFALKVMNEHLCNCGCQHTIAACRAQEGRSCRRCLIFARTIVDAIREGKEEAEVVQILVDKSESFLQVRLPDDAGVVYDIDTSFNPVRGIDDAPISIVEFSDFQCPFCAEMQETLERILEAFPKDVRLVFKQHPLNIHQYGREAARASLAAFSQGKFWQMHDKLFQNFNAINPENISRWAREIGLDTTEFEEAIRTGRYEGTIQKDLADAAAAKVMGTPTLFINGKRVRDRTFESLKKMILEELANLRTSSAARGSS